MNARSTRRSPTEHVTSCEKICELCAAIAVIYVMPASRRENESTGSWIEYDDFPVR